MSDGDICLSPGVMGRSGFTQCAACRTPQASLGLLNIGPSNQYPERHEVTCEDGARLACWLVGPESGPPVVLASGGGADHRGWRSVVPELCESEPERELWARHGRSLGEECRVAVFDQRGTGESVDVPPAGSAEMLGSDVATVCRSLLQTPCTVVGHSMGGMAALQAVLGDPAVARNLALLATTAGGSGLTWPSDSVLNRMAETKNGLDLAVSVRFRSENPELYDVIAKEESAEPRTVDPDALAQVFFSHDVADRLNEISIPVVVVCGSDDQFHPLPNSAYLVEHLPQARFVRLGGVGHLLNVEAPDVLIHEIGHLANSP